MRNVLGRLSGSSGVHLQHHIRVVEDNVAVLGNADLTGLSRSARPTRAVFASRTELPADRPVLPDDKGNQQIKRRLRKNPWKLK